jgi:hypothetical protein
MVDAFRNASITGGTSMARKRERIEPNEGDARFVRRDEEGRFTEDQVDVGRSLAADRRSESETVAPKGMGDRGDQKKRSKK